MTIDKRGLDPFDIAAVRQAYEEHREWHEVEVLKDENDVHSSEYDRTAHKVDVLCEKLGLDYGDDMAELEELWKGQGQEISR